MSPKKLTPVITAVTALAFASVAPRAAIAAPEAPAEPAAKVVHNVGAAEAAKLVGGEDAVIVIDVRTPEEFSEGHLKAAKNIDFNSDGFEAALAKLDKDKPYLIHCRSGGRSTNSLKVFEKLGFQRVYHLDGGINAWNKAGLPVTKASKEDE